VLEVLVPAIRWRAVDRPPPPCLLIVRGQAANMQVKFETMCWTKTPQCVARMCWNHEKAHPCRRTVGCTQHYRQQPYTPFETCWCNHRQCEVYSTQVHNNTAHTAHALLPLCGACGVRRGSSSALFIVRRLVNVRNFASRPTLWASRSRRWPSCEALKSCGMDNRVAANYTLYAENTRRCSAQEVWGADH
jgi:hypothetical protein